jgi:hypothetical protein
MIDSPKLQEAVRGNIEKLCQHFFPNGRKENGEWKLGDVSGAKGNSLGISLSADKAGLWHDRATGDKGNFPQLLMQSRNASFPAAADEISQCLGIDLSSSNGTKPREKDWEWASCTRLSREHVSRMAGWRGYSEAFVEWLVETDTLRVYNKNGSQRWVFPIHLDGKVAGCHSRPIEWAGPERCKWLMLPEKVNGGPGVQPLMIGDLANAPSVHVFESQWDMLAVCDLLSLHLTDGVAAICTRGSSNWKFASRVPGSVHEAFVWQQNDKDGQKWSEGIVRHLPITTTAKIVATPAEYEDPNAWTHDGVATAEDLITAISASVISDPPPVDETKKAEDQPDGPRKLVGASFLEFSRDRSINLRRCWAIDTFAVEEAG